VLKVEAGLDMHKDAWSKLLESMAEDILALGWAKDGRSYVRTSNPDEFRCEEDAA
jgi:hypothetical protein